MKNNILIFIGSLEYKNEDSFGLGDLLRFITISKELTNDCISWSSPKDLFPLVSYCDHIDQVIPVEDLNNYIDQFDLILNLGNTEPSSFSNKLVNILHLFRKNSAFKENTFNMRNKVRKILRLPKDSKSLPDQSYMKGLVKYDIGFNTICPNEWGIKEMPNILWNEVENSVLLDATISRQKENNNLKEYIDWIASCRVIVSVVGFGCHVAMFLNKPLIVLSGPTDFHEIHGYTNGIVIYPDLACNNRPCYKKNGINCDGCMDTINSRKIVKELNRML